MTPRPLAGTLQMPGDKSISHRVLLFGALANGTSRISHLAENADVLATRQCLLDCGIAVDNQADGSWVVSGRPFWDAPPGILDCRNAGTAMRLLSGILSAQPFESVLNGDASLQKRPMGRVIDPLRQMGARLESTDGRAPLRIRPAPEGLRGIAYDLPVASAQVKSALLLAGLYAEGENSLLEPHLSRDHTERMLAGLGVTLEQRQSRLVLPGGQIDRLRPFEMRVPGDCSSAAFFIVAALCIPGSAIRIRQVNLNPTRTGLVSVLKRIGARITSENETVVCGEPVGDLVVEASGLKGDLRVTADEVPALLDEIPILTVAALFLDGHFIVEGAAELRVKESDRLSAMQAELAKLGVTMETAADGLRMAGGQGYACRAPVSVLSSHHDHRIAMSLMTLNRIAGGDPWPMEGREWTDVSFPGFERLMLG